MIPFISMMLGFTSICGAALFAADLEDQRTGKKKEEISVGTVEQVGGDGGNRSDVKKKKEF